MSRHKARETAMKMCFQVDVGSNTTSEAKKTLEAAKLQKELAEFAWSLFEGVGKNQEILDLYLAKFTKDWDLARLANVDKSIIRLSMYELLFTKETPANIVINEGVELAKTFSYTGAGAFVNGVLDNFYHKVVKDQLPEYDISQEIENLKREAEMAKNQAPVVSVQAEAPEPAVVSDEPEQPSVFQLNKKETEGKAYRIIKKADLTKADLISDEDILEDKKRLFGEDAFLTQSDLKRAERMGVTLTDEQIKSVRQPEAAPDYENYTIPRPEKKERKDPPRDKFGNKKSDRQR